MVNLYYVLAVLQPLTEVIRAVDCNLVRRTALVLTVAEIYCHFMNTNFFLRLRPVFVLWDRCYIANSVLYSN